MRPPGLFLAVLVAALVCASPATAASVIPNEPNWYWAWGQRQVKMPNAWEITTGSPNVTVAVVDTGVEPSIPDLQGLFVPGWDFVDNDGVAEDRQGHGTMVATEIGAIGNNGQGIAGYCWRCRIMPVRVSNGGDFSMVLAARGIKWAADHGARIISLSFSDGGDFPGGDPQVAAAIAYAARRNALVFASAGNSGLTTPTYPAASSGAYAVASTDQADRLYHWSTYGSWVSLAAPGCQVMTLPVGASFTACGSSAAAPAVAGIAALMLSVNPSLTPQQVVSALQGTAVPVPGISGGRVDAYRALIAVGGRVPRSPQPPPPPPSELLQRPAVQRPTAWQRPPAAPKVATRVERGVLFKHRTVAIKVKAGRVAATLQSPKARSCVVSLSSSSEVWPSTSARRGTVSVSAKVPAGRYKVDVSCTTPRPKRFALYVRAIFG